MRFTEVLRLVFINLIQNKFKVILTSIGIVVGAATIVMVIAIGRGGQMDVADQFKNINAGAIDISYSMASQSRNAGQGSTTGGGAAGGFVPPAGFVVPPAAASSGGSANTVTAVNSTNSTNRSSSSAGSTQVNSGSASANQGGFTMPSGMQGGIPPNMGGFIQGGGSSADTRINLQRIVLTAADTEDLSVFVPGISDATITYTTKTTVDGGILEEATSYTIAGVKSNYASMSNLELVAGSFISNSDTDNAEKVCVLGSSVAIEIFGSVTDAYDSVIYIGSRPYIVNGVLKAMGSVTSGISPDTAVFIPYETGIKYITGSVNISPTITVVAKDVNHVDTVISDIKTVLGESYPNASFTIADAGTKMDAANASNRTLTYLLFAMATIVFIVGGIGIMNVLFVSVKERTKEIGILKSIDCRKRDILLEFLFEASFISILGGMLGVAVSFLVTPIIRMLSVRVELSVIGFVLAVGFAVVTGTLFGFYPAYKASQLIPVLALNNE